MVEMALETVFKVLILVVATVVIIGIIINLKNIAGSIKLPCFFPPCEEEEKCETQLVDETLTKDVLEKYCNFCWHKTGGINLRQACLCYVIKGSVSSLPQPLSLSNPNCEWSCQDLTATSVFLEYDFTRQKILIKC
ncbi:MAG: hypothetical protein QW841_01695 [Candidatus Aenigmatarchaeota archaeon]